MFKRTIVTIAAAAMLLATTTPLLAQSDPNTPEGTEMTATTLSETGYAEVNGLSMYYEIYGTGEPLVLLHGAYMSTGIMQPLAEALAETRQVIAVDFQGHGRTADIIDRPLSYEQLADDVAALMDAIGIEKADIFGYSMGGGAALQLAVRHPERVNKLIVASMTFNRDGWHADLLALFPTITPEMFAGSPMEEGYAAVAPNPENFPLLVEKLVALDSGEHDWPTESIQAIAAPTLIIAGDSDAVRLEHVIEMFRLRGGGVNGDMTGLPESRLAIIPGATHIGVMFRPDLLTIFATEFLDAPEAGS